MNEPADSSTSASPSPTTPPPKSTGPALSTGSASASDRTPQQQFEDEVVRRRVAGGPGEPEQTLWSGGYSAKAMIGSWIVLVIVSIALFVGPFFVEGWDWRISLIVVVVLWLLVGGSYAARRLGVHYELTSQRFIHKTGILTRRSDRVEVIDIDDVSYRQGPVQRIFNVGSIVISSSDRSHPSIELLGIDNVSEVAGRIDDVRRGERRRRSLHIESI